MKQMLIITITLFYCFFSNNANAQLVAKVYEVPGIDTMVYKHKTAAILPIDVMMKDVRSNKKNRATPEELARQAEEYQKGFQNAMYSWFLKMKQRDRMINVKIQDVDETNALLRKNGINDTDSLQYYTKKEIAEMLGVDALFGGSVETTVSFSNGGAVALALLTGISVKTGDADVFIKLWDANENEVIWSFSRQVASNYANTPNDVVNYLMKRVSKRFPYRKW